MRLIDLDKWQEIFSTLSKHKLRTFLTAMVVSWGIFMLLVMFGAGSALENGAMYEFNKWTIKSLFIWTQRTTIPYNGLQAGRFVPLYMNDIDAVKEKVSGVDRISPRLFLDVDQIVRNDKEGAFTVRGETEALITIEPVEMAEGRFINAFDLEERRKVIVIGQRVSDVLFTEEEAIGQWLKIKGAWFRIVGVAKSMRTGEDSREDDESIFMPITTMQYTYNLIDRVGWFVCTVKEEYETGKVEEQIKAVIAERHDVSPEDKQAIGSFNLEEEFQQFKGLFFGIKFIVLFVSLGTLVAGIVGVGNIMVITVRERTREIGVRKALGATNGSIITMILSEAVMLTTVAGYMGLMAGIGILALADNILGKQDVEVVFFRDPEINLSFALTALALLIFFGALAGLIPARQAAGINPAITLNDE